MAKRKKTEDDMINDEVAILLTGVAADENKENQIILDNNEEETQEDDSEEISEAEEDGSTEAEGESGDQADGDAEGQRDDAEESSSDSEELPSSEGDSEEQVDLATRLAEFEKAVQDEEEETPRSVLKKEQYTLQQLELDLHNNLVNNLPQGGVFYNNGKWVFHMTEPEINQYLTDLKDNGQEFAAAQVQTAILNALQEMPKFQQKLQAYQNHQGHVSDLTHRVEWMEFKSEVTKKLPELTQDDFDNIGKYIDQSASRDAQYAASIANKEGKAQRGIEAAAKLGILARLKQQADSAKTKNKPAATETLGKSKRVNTTVNRGKPTFKRSQVEKMSQAEFNRLPQDVVDLMLAGENIIDD